jgi:hypothetical protein
MYFNGLGCEVDKRKAFEMYEKSAMQENLIAQCNLGNLSHLAILPHAPLFSLFHLSFLLLSRLLTHLGVMFDTGEGCAQDKLHAFEMFKKSAEQGYEIAQFNLGTQAFILKLGV